MASTIPILKKLTSV